MALHGFNDFAIHDIVSVEGLDVVADLVRLQGEQRHVVEGCVHVPMVVGLAVGQDFRQLLFLLFQLIVVC
jgi:hypothetical protein